MAAIELRHAGTPVKLTLEKLSDRTFEVRLQRTDSNDFNLPFDAALPGSREVLWQGTSLDQAANIPFGSYQIHLSSEPLALEVRDASKKVIQSFQWQPEGKTFTFHADAPVFGLGGGGPGFDRRGAVFPMKDGWGGYKRESHGSRVAVPYLISPAGWSLFFNHLPGQMGEFDLRNPIAGYRPDAAQDALPFDLFVSLSEDPALLAVERGKIEGNAPLPPKWALGYMQSHRTLAGPDEVMSVAKTFRDHHLPCDALIYLGTGYCPAGWNKGHGSLDFNPKIFPKPAEMMKDLHDLDFKVVLHANRVPEKLHGDTLTPDGGDSIGSYWESHLPAFATGADAWWPDDGDELSAASRVARHRLYELGPLRERSNERPWSLHRTGYLGVQKYGGWMWSGDPDSTWDTLRAQVTVGLNHSVSLTPFWGSDTGGFIPSKELTSELYVRWFEFSCFTPSFRSHGRSWHLHLPWGWNTGEFGPLEVDANFTGLPALEDTRNPGIEPICKKYLELRYQLLTYNYTLARETSERGIPMMRPLWMHAPDEPETMKHGDEFFWGKDLLVAPVLEKGATRRTLYLPKGKWYDFWTGLPVEGGREITRPADLATLPLYVRAGAVLPIDPVRQFTSQATDEPLALRIYPGADGGTEIYQDDGTSMDFSKGLSLTTQMTWRDGPHMLHLKSGKKSDYVPAWPKRIRVESANGQEVRTIPWDGSKLDIPLEH
ncbi:TIM-barrel domain-containing protein [Luteolibacter sp.]|uniref:TIM-barrel domain-containing protein n=1 Tax=Luteolibacter sp. TaxID=1962973 RepID=UPI003263D8DB